MKAFVYLMHSPLQFAHDQCCYFEDCKCTCVCTGCVQFRCSGFPGKKWDQFNSEDGFLLGTTLFRGEAAAKDCWYLQAFPTSFWNWELTGRMLTSLFSVASSLGLPRCVSVSHQRPLRGHAQTWKDRRQASDGSEFYLIFCLKNRKGVCQPLVH